MKELNGIKKSLVLMIILNVGAVFAFGFLLYEIRNKIRNTDEVSYKISIERTENDSLEEAEKALKNVEQKVSTLDTYILKESDLAGFLKTIESTAKDLGLTYKNEIQKIGNAKEKDQELKITFSLAGSWSKTVAMLALIENLPYEIDVTNFSTRSFKIEEKGGGVEWKGDIMFSVVIVK